MILHFNYEELTALRAGARVFLDREEPGRGRVLAPSEEEVQVEALLTRLVGDISVDTLEELRDVQMAVSAIVECLRVEMESLVTATHAAHETAVAAYFEFAHAFTVARRLDETASEMAALIELMTGEPPTPESSRSFQFPD